MPVVIRFGRLGDIVLQTPLLHLLHRRFGQPCRLITAGSWARTLLAGHPDVDSIWQLRQRHAPFLLSPERWRLVAELRRCGGPIYVSENSERQVAKLRRMFALAGIAREQCLFLSDLAAPADHWVDRLLQLGGMTPEGFFPERHPPADAERWTAPRLFVDAADRHERDTWLCQHGIGGHPVVLVQPGNKRALKWGRLRDRDAKAWPIAHWAQLLRALRSERPSVRIVLCGSRAETRLLEDIQTAAAVDGIVIPTSELPLRRLLALMETAHSMVSVDTGPAHMAAAIGCPLVVLYGGESPRVWGRRSPTGSPIIELGGPPEHDCVAAIAADRVIAAWAEVLGGARRRHEPPPASVVAIRSSRRRVMS